jgi:uncharacterized protein (TIGR00255 family)
MTGFGSCEGSIGEQKYRIEVKTLNHRFLDIKVKLPRELYSADQQLRAKIQSKLSRGSVDFKIERIQEASTTTPSLQVQPNLELAKSYSEALRAIQKATGASGEISAAQIASLPDVLTRNTQDLTSEEAWKKLEPLVSEALTHLSTMRAHEGQNLKKILNEAASEMETKIKTLRSKRAQVTERYPDKIKEKVKAIFEMYPLENATTATILESRISQELALLMDRTDIEEELVRFQGHLDHLRKVLNEGGQVGRKLDFVLQELGREINTLGNKAQDYSMSEDVVQVKVKLEQLREQVMNLE